jgi:hypothetical protein
MQKGDDFKHPVDSGCLRHEAVSTTNFNFLQHQTINFTHYFIAQLSILKPSNFQTLKHSNKTYTQFLIPYPHSFILTPSVNSLPKSG